MATKRTVKVKPQVTAEQDESTQKEKIAYGLAIIAARKAAFGMSRSALSRLTNIPVKRITQIESGKVELTKEEITTIFAEFCLSEESFLGLVDAILRTNISDKLFVETIRSCLAKAKSRPNEVLEVFNNHTISLRLLGVRLFTLSKPRERLLKPKKPKMTRY